jgi:hemolysin III
MTAQPRAPELTGRPILRGWSHALATPLAALFTVLLVTRCVGDWSRLASMLVYGLSLVLMFGWSAAYHIVTWPPHRRRLMWRVDYANIYLVIAATATAVGANVLAGWEGPVVVTVVWLFAIGGVLVMVLNERASAGLRVAMYIGLGAMGFVTLPSLLAALPVEAVVGLIGGGLLYAIGGVVYWLRRPDPFPRVFGYHEVFHLLVLAGATVFAAVIWVWVVPHVGS